MQLAYRFLSDGESDEMTITHAELDLRARSIGARLQMQLRAGDRAILLLPPGLDFAAAFWGCLYAGVIAVPCYPPHPARLEKSMPVIRHILQDASPKVALVDSPLLKALSAAEDNGVGLGISLLAVDGGGDPADAAAWHSTRATGADVALLQYTSGSTSSPKGVAVSHGNLMHNLALISKCFGVTPESAGVIWLPPYHDMGLIGGILQPLHSGIPVTLLPHMLFLQRPLRWLQAISKYGATISGGPNFAYDLCVKKIKPGQCETLDLGRWEVAFNGAEPVRKETMERFSSHFSHCGFRHQSFLPCYGLAEGTLMVTGGPIGRTPVTLSLASAGLERDQVILLPPPAEGVQTLAGSGRNLSDQKLSIVNPETLAPCGEGEVGEIWVSGESVALSYWNRPEETSAHLQAQIPGQGQDRFLRTGDLGFLHDGELFVTGRLKDLIISEGKNHYPQDIERTAEDAHTAIRPGGCAVFSLESGDREAIVALVELEHLQGVNPAEIGKALQAAVSGAHGLRLDDILLVGPGGIPRTTSGKVRRHLCRANYLAGTIKEITLT